MRARGFVLADVDRPPDTSRLMTCGENETAAAIAALRAHAVRARERAMQRRDARARADRLVAAVRRLDSAQVQGYRDRGLDVLVSEPFNRLPCAALPAPRAVADTLVGQMVGGPPRPALVQALAPFGEAALQRAVDGSVTIVIMSPRGRFSDHSGAVAKLVPSIDQWPSPPAGLFVVEERRILLRDRALGMTAAHEFAHALDAVLARKPRSYYSYEDDGLRHCFGAASGFVNEYAASGLDEYFAESVRAYLEVNDSRCMWLPLTRAALQERDPRMFALVEALFESGFSAR